MPTILPTNHPTIDRTYLKALLTISPTSLSILPHYQSFLTINPSYLRALPNTSVALPKPLNTTKILTDIATPSKMSTYSECLASFTSWPRASPSPNGLVRAGLGHKPMSESPDNVICKTCKSCVCDWEPEDNPELELHILHPKSCSSL